jgi:ABC-type multidrug transport system ATPase subunit
MLIFYIEISERILEMSWANVILLYTMNQRIVSMSSVHKAFGLSPVLQGIDCAIREGTVFGLVGLNGAGKTTLIRLLAGLLKPDTGAVSVAGFDPWNHAPSFYTKVGIVLEHDGFVGNLQIRDNIELFAQAKALSSSTVERYIERFWHDSVITTDTKRVKYLSRGQKMQCALCRAFMGTPSVVLLDEPTVALDMEAYDHFCSLVMAAKERGAAVCISSHQFETIEQLCDTVGILHNGVIDKTITLPYSTENSQWRIATAENEAVRKLLSEVSGSAPVFRNGAWFVELSAPQQQVPDIIRRCSTVESDIYEVARCSESLKETIKRMYGV